MTVRDAYLSDLCAALKEILKGKENFQVNGPDVYIETPGEPRSFWPRADILVKISNTQVIVETDENSDPCRSIIKYWPYLEKHSKERIALIEIWKRGDTIGQGFFSLARFIGKKFEGMFPNFHFFCTERHTETAEQMAQWIFVQLQEIINSEF